MPRHEKRQEDAPADRRSGFHLRLPKWRFIKPLLYAAVTVFVVVTIYGWFTNWRLGADIVERDGVIAAYKDSVETANAVKDSLVVVVSQGDSARARQDSAMARVDRRVTVLLATLSQRPTQVIRLPGETDTVTLVVIGEDTTTVTPEIGERLEACNTLAVTCADLQVAARLKATADSTSIAQRDDVILAHEKKDTLQATKDSVQTEQITALKKRSAGSPITVVLGPGIYYDMTSCEAVVVVSDEFASAVATQDCPTIRWGIGVTGGLDLIWSVGKVVAGFRLFGL